MCTVTWQRTRDGYRLLFNRDESDQRPLAAPPQRFEEGGCVFIAPLDPQGGGTWIATNEFGVTVCLLNDYQGVASEAARSDPESRGLLVRALAGCKTEREVSQHIRTMDLRRVRPFLLLALGPVHGPFAWHHSGQQLTLRLGVAAPVTSSGVEPDAVHAHRSEAFARLGTGPHSIERLRAYHRGDFTAPGPKSVAMKRRGRGTVSVTEVEVTSDKVRFAYFPGHPTSTRLMESETEITMNLVRSGQEEPPQEVPHHVFSLDSLFAEKNPTLHRKVPTWGFSLLERLIGGRRINEGLAALGPIPPSAFAERALDSLGVEVRVELPASMPEKPAPIYAANHPLGGIDGLALLSLVRHLHGAVVAPINDVLMRIPHAQSFGVGIDKSRTKKALVASVARTFEAGAPVLLFPAGMTSRRFEGKLQDPPWGKMVVQRALRHQRPIVPLFVSGKNSELFYWVHRLRTKLGIGANLEMFLLPREVLRPTARQVSIVGGSPLSPDDIEALGASDAERVEALRALCYQLEPRSGVSP